MKDRQSLVLMLAWLAVAATLRADWSRFRGPNGSGISDDGTAIPVTWSPSENLKWKVPLPGPGSSSPIVVGDKIFVTCWSGYGTDRADPGDQANLRRHLLCIDRHTGSTIWSKSVEPVLPEDRYGGMFAEHGYASHTPVSDGERVYAFFGKTGVLAFDMDGNQLWQTSVGTESGARDWGSASSPLLYKNLLIVPATAESESLVGLDKLTGEEVWRQEASGFNSTWGSPVLARVDDENFDLVIAVPQEIWGLDPETGKLNWYCEAVPVDSICSSVVADDKGVVYAIESSRGGGGGVAVKAAGKQPNDQRDVTDTHVLWSGRQANRIGTPIIYQGRLYAVNNKTVHCVDAATGDEVFTARLRSGGRASDEQDRDGGGGRGRRGGFGGTDYGSPILADGKIYFTSRGGETFVLTAGAPFEQLAVNRVTTDVEDFSATPAVSDGALYIRSDKHLYCVSAN